MRYNRLGRTGLFVSELCLGTMTFGGDGMWTAMGQVDQAGANALVRRALDAGINFIDTANVYSNGWSERITGQALRDLDISRSEVVIATKALGPMGQGVNDRGASRYHLLAQIDASLERLQLDHVDLYQIHGWDAATPLEETLRALDDIVRSGRARYIGVSNWAAWQIVKALGIAENRGWERFASLQAYYSVAGRDLERDIVPMLGSEGLGLMVWSPLAGGFLSGKYTRESEGEGRRASFDFPPIDKERGYDVIAIMREIAGRHGATVPQVALAWLLARPAVSSVILGAKRIDQLEDNLGAADLVLSPEELARLDGGAPLVPEYPGWMIERQSEYRSGAMAGEAPRR
ncbi:aldo/keto reductase [Novosphingobium album (ex Liu et al. 2023)]|uniref:Aldo/keto reductase n=1 Tax=Novosphingobium album (ex Liu et al. 2023) TaxID=3031130 RepID=A0ABT5WP48_9SPHN|nr:aldo/keto reductase [Novosphingobium album (ex Liu et al. 2023)]MDE8651812.1 aldo/keto reductase [Novosphingobium album (ex Liu et al. 2023)]